MQFTAPDLEYGHLAPLIFVFLSGTLGVAVEATVPRRARAMVQTILVTIGLVGGGLATAYNAGVAADEPDQNLLVGAEGSLVFDGPTHFIWFTLIVLTFLTVFMFGERKLGGATPFTPQAASLPGTPAEREATAHKLEHTEVYPLAMFALAGMMLFPAAGDLLTMFVALEIMSLPLYLLCGLARRRRLLSQEAALKYFMLGSFSSAFFVMGMAMLYGYAGAFDLGIIAEAITMGQGPAALLVGGMGMLAVGMLFKVGAVPFHNWTPDVYQGAPTVVTGFMAACVKIAAFGALLRVFFVGLGAARWDWQPFMATIAVLTMFVGAVIGIVQDDVKRMLAYSSIAHAGFILVALVGAAEGETIMGFSSVAAVLFYLAVYGFTTIGAFAILTMVRDAGGEVSRLSSWAGLGRTNPGVAGLFALFLLSFAGIPLTSGFMGKMAVFGAAWQGGFGWLVVVAVIASLVAAFFYLRVIVVMFFNEPSGEVEVHEASGRTWLAVAVALVTTVGFGILPDLLMPAAQMASTFLR